MLQKQYVDEVQKQEPKDSCGENKEKHGEHFSEGNFSKIKLPPQYLHPATQSDDVWRKHAEANEKSRNGGIVVILKKS